MKQRPDRSTWARWTRRRWPDLLLALLCVSSVLLQPLTTPGAWWAGAALWLAAAGAVGFDALVGGGGDGSGAATRDRRLLVLGVTGAHTLSVLLAGAGAAAGSGALVWALADAIAVVVAAARLAGWLAPFALVALAAALESAHLLLLSRLAAAAPVPLRAWFDAGVALLLLAALAALAAQIGRRSRRERAALLGRIEEHERLRGEAEELRALGDRVDEPAAERLSPRGKTTRIMSAVVENDRALERILALAALSVGARSVVLFLLAEDGERLRVRSAVDGRDTQIDRDATPRLGEGVVGHAARTRRPALFTNLDPGSLRPRLYDAEIAVPSLMIVPVSESDRFRGVLVADAAAPGAFGSEQERILAGFSAEIGVLLENARSDASREKRGHRLESLRFIIQALSSTIKVDEVLAKLVELTRGIVPCDRCALFIADPAAPELVLRAQHGFFPAPVEEVRMAADHGLAGFVAGSGRPLLFSDLKESNLTAEIVPGAPGQENIRSFLGLPIRHQEGLVGVLVLASEQSGRFDSNDLDILSVVAAQAATLISNAVLHQTVERMAVTDGLTGLYNHRWFQERLAHELDRGDRNREPLSLLLLDIDHFKKINDTYGHPFGDKVLKTLSAELKKLARRVDCVARYGGEEFAIVLVNTDRRGCRASAERVLKAVRAIRIPHEGSVFTFTLSIGTATCPDDAATREDLVRCSDQALYAAKEAGRNQAVAFEKTEASRAARAAGAGSPERVARR